MVTRYRIEGATIVAVVGRERGVLYDEHCGFAPEELTALCWLLNHGYGDLDWFAIEPLVARRVAQQREASVAWHARRVKRQWRGTRAA